MEKTITEKIVPLLVLSLLLIPTVQLFYLQAHAAIGPSPQASSYTFGATQNVEHFPGRDDQPSAFQLSNGTIWLAWESNRAGPFNIYLKTWNVSAATPSWTSSVRLTTTGSNSHPSLSQFPNGTIILVWTANLTRSDNLYYMTYTGARWSSIVQLTSGSYQDEFARTVITADSTLWVVWERDTPTGVSRPTFYHQIYYKTMSGTNSWTADTPLTSPSIDSVSPSVTIAKRGILWFAWTRNATTVYNVVYRTLNGTTWSGDNTLTSTTSNDRDPYMVQDRNGTMWLFWSRPVNFGLGSQLFDKFSSDMGKTWTGDNRLTSGGTATDPVLDIEPSTIQGYDTRLWLFYSSNQFNLDFDLYWLNSGQIVGVHDILVTTIQVSTPWTYPWGDAPQKMVTINVTLSNIGDVDESMIAVTIRAVNNTSITVGTVLMNAIFAGTTGQAIISWDTLATHASPGRYTIVASIPRIPGETIGSTPDNTLTNKYAEMVLLPGALAKTPCITIIDAGMMGKAFGTTQSNTNWNPDADLDNNGIITIIDFGILASKFGKCV